MRSFSRSDWDASQAAWRDGEFSDEWKGVRHQAAMRGMIYPPEGTRWDSWDDDEPSQRAMLIRAIRETPQLLATAISRSHSWGQVIEYVIKRRDDIRAELDERERDKARQRAEEAGPREAVASLKAILNRIGDS
jgi:hypothetical protein